MQIDYTTIGQQVAEWQEGYIQHVRENHGEDFAAETERELKDDPWKALRWFMEDMSR